MCQCKYFRRFLLAYYFLTIICTSVSSNNNACNFNIKMQQVLLNQGFHRNITYGILFHNNGEKDWLYKNCIVGLEQTLPPGVYVNPDELGDLRRGNRVNAFPKNKVNVELPAEQASTTSVYIIGNIIDNHLNLWVPVHARYHYAITGGGMVRNELSSPTLHLRCPNSQLQNCKAPITSGASSFCQNTREKCDWVQVPYTLVSKPLRWEVPVGNTDHYYIISLGTLLVIVVGSLYILKIIHDHKMKRSKKKQ